MLVPANRTDRLQPLDVAMNKAAKECMRRQFHEWYSNFVCKQLDVSKENKTSVDLSMSVMKPLGVKWLIGLNNYIKSSPEFIKNGFKEAGVLQ